MADLAGSGKTRPFRPAGQLLTPAGHPFRPAGGPAYEGDAGPALPDPSSRVAFQLVRHLDHCPPEPRAREQALRGLIPLCRREHDPGCAAGLERRQRGVEQHPADALPAMGGIDHDVMQHACRPAQRHVIIPLDSRVRIADHLAVALGDKDDDVRLVELRPEKRAISVLGLRRRSDEAVRVEVVVRTDEECAEPADGREVRGRCGAEARRANNTPAC